MYALGSLAFVFLNHNVVAPTAGSFIWRSEMMKRGWYADHKLKPVVTYLKRLVVSKFFWLCFFCNVLGCPIPG